MDNYELVAMQQQSIQGVKRLLKNTKTVITYQSSVPVSLIKSMKEDGVIRILHWDHATKEGFQRIENEKHILDIAEYIIKPNALTPQNIIFSIRKDSYLRFNVHFNEVGSLIVNKDSIVTLLDGQHRVSAFIKVLDRLEEDMGGLLEYIDNNSGEPYQIWKLLRADYEKDTPEKTYKALEQLYKQLIDYKLSCNFISNLTEKQEIEIFLNLNTKGLHIDRGLADHLQIALGTVNNVKGFAYKYIHYIQNTPDNIFHEFLKPVNQKAITGTITETSFARSISKTRLVSKFVELYAKKDYTNPKALNDFIKIMDDYWAAVKDVMPDAFDLNQQKKYSLIRSAGMESFSNLLIRIISNQTGLRGSVPNFELSYPFFRTCFDILKKHPMGFTKQENWEKGGYSAKSFGSSANKSLGEEMWDVIQNVAFNRQLIVLPKYGGKKIKRSKIQKAV